MRIPEWCLYFFVVLLPAVVYAVVNKKKEGIIINGVEYGLIAVYSIMLPLDLPMEIIGVVALIVVAFVIFCLVDCIRLIQKNKLEINIG